MDCSEDWLIDLLVGSERKRETHNGSKRFGLRKGKNNHNNKTKQTMTKEHSKRNFSEALWKNLGLILDM